MAARSELHGVTGYYLLRSLIQFYSPSYKSMLDELSAHPQRAQHHFQRLYASGCEYYEKQEYLDALNQIVFAVHVDVTYPDNTGPHVDRARLAVTLLKCLIGVGYADILERLYHDEFKAVIRFVHLGGEDVEQELIEALNNSVMWTERREQTLSSLNGHVFKNKRDENVVKPNGPTDIERVHDPKNKKRLSRMKKYRKMAIDLVFKEEKFLDALECIRLWEPLFTGAQLDSFCGRVEENIDMQDESDGLASMLFFAFVAAVDAWCLDRALNPDHRDCTKDGLPCTSEGIISMLRYADAPIYRKLRCLSVIKTRGYCLSFSEKDLENPNKDISAADDLAIEGKYTEAVNQYTAILDRLGGLYNQGGLSKIHYKRGMAFAALKRYQEARSDLQQSVDEDKENNDAKKKLREVTEEAVKMARSSDPHMKKTSKKVEIQRYAEGLESAEARKNTVGTELSSIIAAEKVEGATKTAEHVEETNASEPDTETGRHKKLSKSARRRRNKKAREKEGGFEACTKELEGDQIEEAASSENPAHSEIHELDETVSSEPRVLEVGSEMARVNSLYKDGKLQEAVDSYTSLLTRLGEDYPQKELAIIHYNRGSALLKLAESNFQNVLKINPRHTKAKSKLDQITG